MNNQALKLRHVFDENRQVKMAYSALAKVLIQDTQRGESVMDYYVKKVVLDCGTLHSDTLADLQGESMRRLQFQAFEGWSDTLWERVTWHDVTLWFMLPTLLKECGYVTSLNEREMLQSVYKACTREDGDRFKIMTAILYAR